VPIDRENLAHLLRSPRRHQGLGGPDTLELTPKLRQRPAVRAPATQGPERRLAGSEPREPVDTQHGGKKQRLKAAQKRRLAVRHQGKVIARRRRLLGLSRLRELRHNRVKGLLLVAPMGKHRHADT